MSPTRCSISEVNFSHLAFQKLNLGTGVVTTGLSTGLMLTIIVLY